MDNKSDLEPTQSELEFDDDLSNSTFDINFSETTTGPYGDYTTMSAHTIDTITLSASIPGVTMSTSTPSITISPSGTNIMSQSGAAGAYVVGGLNGTMWSNTISPSSSKITLMGKDADIDIGGTSLVATLKGIQDRLNILRPNTELESEWDELRELGKRYRQLEAELEEKSRVWKALNQ